MDDYKYVYVDQNTTTQVKEGRGVLHSIVIGQTTTGKITIADSVDGDTPVIGILKASVAEGTYFFNCTFVNGLRIITDEDTKLTVVYR